MQHKYQTMDSKKENSKTRKPIHWCPSPRHSPMQHYWTSNTNVQEPLHCNIVSIDPNIPLHLWGLLFPQTVLALNLLCQLNVDPTVAASQYVNGTFDYNPTFFPRIEWTLSVSLHICDKNERPMHIEYCVLQVLNYITACCHSCRHCNPGNQWFDNNSQWNSKKERVRWIWCTGTIARVS